VSDHVTYSLEPDLDPAEWADVLRRSTLGERRPLDRPDTIRRMVANAQVMVTARVGGLLVGASRALTDFVYVTYLSDLAVDEAYQRRGIGQELLRRTHEAAGVETMLILIAAPKAQEYYRHIGMTYHDSCWYIPGQRTAPGSPPPTPGSER
jgi:GNAT superfamily N-acetyltransferase